MTHLVIQPLGRAVSDGLLAVRRRRATFSVNSTAVDLLVFPTHLEARRILLGPRQ